MFFVYGCESVLIVSSKICYYFLCVFYLDQYREILVLFYVLGSLWFCFYLDLFILCIIIRCFLCVELAN